MLSRYSILPLDPRYKVEVGFDPSLSCFFIVVTDRTLLSQGEDVATVFWEPVVTTLEEIVELLMRYAHIDVQLLAQLRMEQLTESRGPKPEVSAFVAAYNTAKGTQTESRAPKCEAGDCTNDADIRCDLCDGCRCPEHSWDIIIMQSGRAAGQQMICCREHTDEFLDLILASRDEDDFGPSEHLTITHRSTQKVVVQSAALYQG